MGFVDRLRDTPAFEQFTARLLLRFESGLSLLRASVGSTEAAKVSVHEES
jgi:hypothetical protein